MCDVDYDSVHHIVEAMLVVNVVQWAKTAEGDGNVSAGGGIAAEVVEDVVSVDRMGGISVVEHLGGRKTEETAVEQLQENESDTAGAIEPSARLAMAHSIEHCTSLLQKNEQPGMAVVAECTKEMVRRNFGSLLKPESQSSNQYIFLRIAPSRRAFRYARKSGII